MVSTGQLLHTLRARILAERLQAFDDPLLNRFGEGVELSLSRRGEEDRVGHREGLKAELFQNRIE